MGITKPLIKNFFFSPERPADDNVALDGDGKRGVDGASLRDEGERVDDGYKD